VVVHQRSDDKYRCPNRNASSAILRVIERTELTGETSLDIPNQTGRIEKEPERANRTVRSGSTEIGVVRNNWEVKSAVPQRMNVDEIRLITG